LLLCQTVRAGRLNETMPYCSDVVPCMQVAANNFTFQCRLAGPQQGTPVILLHGFPKWSYWWLPLLARWETGADGLRGIACDLRGYSPAASPDDPELYAYSHMVADVLAIADAFQLKAFHLVGHDHGANLGWNVAGLAPAGRLLSYTSLTMPHPDAFKRLMGPGPDADELQQLTSTFNNQFALIDSASRNGEVLSWFMDYGGFETRRAEDFQRALWWYYAAFSDKNPSMGARPPVDSFAQVWKTDAMPLILAIQKMIPLRVAPAQPGRGHLGNISIPVMFMCGAQDNLILCTRASHKRTAEYVSGAYTYRNVSCAHDFFYAGRTGCSTEADAGAVMEAITTFILSHTRREGGPQPLLSHDAQPPRVLQDYSLPLFLVGIFVVLFAASRLPLHHPPYLL